MTSESLILIAEDSRDDLSLIFDAFNQGRLANPVQVVRDGEQLIAYLSGKGIFSSREKYPLPALLLLDLDLPRQHGLEVLEWIRRQPALNSLRVVVLTSSAQMQEANRAYQLGANSFLVKPIDFIDFVRLTQAISGRWLWDNREFTPQRISLDSR